ncbi:Hpt domain-containing protein [Tabrizicola sp. BL-A-41-H6]|uniref:Hpt domain-containing protein n=1 Tax=Tabrizicola sp. BL-A-41-H6 TaxID=3421107 RepID=UPI003D67CFA9
MLDKTALDRLTAILGDDPADLADLLETFQDEGPGLVAALQSAAVRQDGDGVRRVAHSLKSSARDIGAVALAETCAEIEAMLRAGAAPDAALIDRVGAEWAVLHTFLRTETTRLKGL